MRFRETVQSVPFNIPRGENSMIDHTSAFTSFVLDLHKRSTNFSRTVLKLVDKHLEEGKAAISMYPSVVLSSPAAKMPSWKTTERGVSGALLFDSLMEDGPTRRLIMDCRQRCSERKTFLLLSVTSDDCPASHRDLLRQHDLRDHLVLPLCYEKNPLGILSVFRGKEDPYFSQEDLSMLQDAAKCISSVYYLDNRNNRKVLYYFHRFLDDMDIGAALIDRQLRIIDSNKSFRDYFEYVWKEGILTGKIPEYTGDEGSSISDFQKLIYHFGPRIIVRPEKLRCDCMLYNYRLYTKPLAYANAFGEIETIYLIYVSQYKKISTDETMDLLAELTPRETELLMLLTEGNDNTQISEKLHITTHTVKSHLQNIYRKLDVTNKTELITKLYGK